MFTTIQIGGTSTSKSARGDPKLLGSGTERNAGLTDPTASCHKPSRLPLITNGSHGSHTNQNRCFNSSYIRNPHRSLAIPKEALARQLELVTASGFIHGNGSQEIVYIMNSVPQMGSIAHFLGGF